MKTLTLLISVLIGLSLYSKPKSMHAKNLAIKSLKLQYAKVFKGNKELKGLKARTFALGAKSVPVLIDVMKKSTYPDKNRWVATFMLGRIMGKKASPFVSKFMRHPNWVMRLAAMKTLLALGETKYSYSGLLKDKSLLVRSQALQNIKKLKKSSDAKFVWAMLYDKRNYHGKLKDSSMIKEIITTVGDLKFKEAQKPLLEMMKKKKYEGLLKEIDYSLAKISGKDSPKGNMKVKKIFWSRYGVSQKTI